MSEISVIGVGIGHYPKRIERIFKKCIWSINPTSIIAALSHFFENEAQSSLKEIQLLEKTHLEITKIKQLMLSIHEKSSQEVVYKALSKYLNDQPLYRELISNYQ